MYKLPLAGIRKDVASVLGDLISSDDSYHLTHTRRFARTLEVLLDQRPSGKILEVGTSGVMTLAIQHLLPEVELHVTQYNKKSQIGTYSKTIGEYSGEFISYLGNLEINNLQVQDETFNFVICSEVIEHMEQDPMFLLSELNRVTKTNGKLLLTTPNITSSRNISKMLKGIDPYFYMQYRKSGSLDRHNYEYSLFSISKLLKAAGFTGAGWTEDTFESGDHTDILKLRGLGYQLPHIGDNIFCVATKKGPVVDRHPAGIYSD